MPDLSAIWDERATEEEYAEAMQSLIDAGTVWSMEGSMGRAAMAAIDAGLCMLGPEPVRDYWGSRIPSRWEVVPGTPGSPEHCWIAS